MNNYDHVPLLWMIKIRTQEHHSFLRLISGKKKTKQFISQERVMFEAISRLIREPGSHDNRATIK